MKASPRLALTLFTIALLAGCSKQGAVNGPADPAGASPDQAEVAATLAADPSLVNDEVSESQDQTTLAASPASASRSAGLAAAIQPITFWRHIRDVERRFEFAFADTDTTGRPTTATVTVHRIMRGSFDILVADQVPEGEPPHSHVVYKPLVDHGVRRILLKRVRLADPASDRRVWRIVATSGSRVTSRDASSRIESLRIESGGLDTTLTGPLAFFRLRRIVQLDPLADVTLTATTLRNDDVALLYLAHRRVPFHNNGDNTYTITFRVPDDTGLHHVGVNALSNGTLFDDAAPYDSQSWIVPFIVHPLTLADGAPLD